MTFETLGAIVAPLLIIMTLSYVVAENPLYRLAQHILVGVAIGYGAVTVIFDVLVPAFVGLGNANTILAFLPGLFLAFLFTLRLLPAGRGISNLVLAFVVAVVAAVSLGGAVAGIVVPQVISAAPRLGDGDIIGNVVLVVGTLLVLYSFRFTVRADPAPGGRFARLDSWLRTAGRWWLMFALGAVLASVFLTRVAALADLLRYFALPS